jgi:protein-tyrosine phosphatase
MKNHKILFVCYGNICRSPSAHGIFEQMVKRARLEHRIAVDSAGTNNLHAGEPPDARSQHHANVRGYDISHLRARAITNSDFERFDVVLTMDEGNKEDCRKMCATTYLSKIKLLTTYCSIPGVNSVPDPYFGEQKHFEHVLDVIENSCERLLLSLMGG